jgi:hypothetical protein
MKGSLVELSDLSNMLAQRIDALVKDILPNGKLDGPREWRVGSPAGEAGRSMAVHLGGRRQGVWSDFSSGEKGDALDLVAVVLFGGNKVDAIAWAKSWLGIDNMDPDRLDIQRRAASAAAEKRRAASADNDKKILSSAQRIWHGAAPLTGEDPASRYLAGRGIDFKQLAKLPGSLRYSSACWCAETKSNLPAMVAAIMNGQGQFVAVHRTYLKRRPDLTWGKADLKESKKVLSRYRGGFIALNRGQSGKPLRDAPQGDHVLLCEGIEDGLTLALACPELRILAAVSLSNFQNIALPPAVTHVTIAADNDGDNLQAQKGLDAAIQHFLRQKRQVFVTRSPEGKDFNDLLQAQLKTEKENKIDVG